MSKEIVEAVRGLAAEKNISSEKLMEALEDALLSAYKKTPGSAPYAKVEMDRDSGDFIVWELKIPPELEEQLLVEATTDQQPTVDPETGEMREPPEPEIDPEKLKEYEDQIEIEDVTPHDFGRIAAQTAKQVILQRIREAERDMMFEEYRDRVGELITGIVQQSDSRYTLVQLRERVEALLPKSEQVEGERYDHSQRIKAVIKDVSNSTKGPSIIVSRRDPELIKSLFELEVPEIADGLVEITGVAREPGYRSKIAVVSHVDGVDPVGACVGPRGSRVRMVVSELRGEKIDIIPYNDEPARFVAKALSPARVREVLVDDAGKQATVIVPDDQLSLAIGREGQNARLAARLTGWRIDIRSETEFAAEEARARLRGGGRHRGPLRGDPHQRPAVSQRCPSRVALLRDRGPSGSGPSRHRSRRRRADERDPWKPLRRRPTALAQRRRRLRRMNKRVHEIAKERGLATKDVLAQLQAAGVPVKASSSSVDEDLAQRILISTTAKSSPTPVRAEGDGAPRTPPPVRRDPRTIGTGVKGPPRAIPKIPKVEPPSRPAPEPAPVASARPTRGRAHAGQRRGNGAGGATPISVRPATRCRASALRATPAGAGAWSSTARRHAALPAAARHSPTSLPGASAVDAAAVASMTKRPNRVPRRPPLPSRPRSRSTRDRPSRTSPST